MYSRHHDKFPQGHIGRPLDLRHGGGGSLFFRLGSALQRGLESLVFFRSHGAEEIIFFRLSRLSHGSGHILGHAANRCGILHRSRLGKLHLRTVGCFVQCSQHTVVNAVENCLFGEEFHFRFGGMDIDVHRIGRQRQMQYAGGKFADHQPVAVGFFQCRHQQLGLDGTVVHEEGL